MNEKNEKNESEKNESGYTTTAPVETTNTPAQGTTVVGGKPGAAKPKDKPPGSPPVEVIKPVVVQEQAAKASEGIVEYELNVGPLKEITKDTHTRMTQYLGIVNPGVLRIMHEILVEHETKIVNLLDGVGVKFK